jgi:Ser/Thr protein kinase RdoA (MazF antagonist)
MWADSLGQAAGEVLSCYARPFADVLIPLGNHGGFSGARLWRLQKPGAWYCLRAWPPDGMTAQRLLGIHALMRAARTAGLDFVPELLATREGSTWVARAGQLWELTTWMPGRAEFHACPTAERLRAVCMNLARLHSVWAQGGVENGPCPAVQRRLDCAQNWLALVGRGWQPDLRAASADPIASWAGRAWRLAQQHIERVPVRLAAWRSPWFSLQSCLGDPWHDHVLFDGGRLTGLLDYGSLKVDHVAQDLARLLGSLIEDDKAKREAGLRAYNQVRPLAPEEQELVSVLDETGTILGMVNWLRWIYLEGRHYENPHAVASRLAQLVTRAERWSATSVG